MLNLKGLRLANKAMKKARTDVSRNAYVGTCTTAANTVIKVVTVDEFPVDSNNKPLPGTIILVKFTSSNGVSNAKLDVNNTGAEPIWYNSAAYTSASTPAGEAGRYIMYVWDGEYWCWQSHGVDNNTDNAPGRLYGSAYKTGAVGSIKNVLAMMNLDGHIESIVTTSSTSTTKARNTAGFRLGQVYYNASGTVEANTSITSNYLWVLYTGAYIDFRYSANCGKTLVAHKPLYLVGTIGVDGLFYLDTTWWSQTLPTTDDGKVYIDIGVAYDTYRFIFNGGYNAWCYKDGMLKRYV